MENAEKNYQDYFDSIGTNTLSKEAQAELMKRPQSWNRFFEEAIFNTIAEADLPKSESRFYQDYFEHAHERISYKSMKIVVEQMDKAHVQLVLKKERLLFVSNEMEKVNLLGWLADLFPKYG